MVAESGPTSPNFAMAIRILTAGSSTITVKSALTLAHASVTIGKSIVIVAGNISLLVALGCRAHVGVKTVTTMAMTLLGPVTAMTTAVVPVGLRLAMRQVLHYPRGCWDGHLRAVAASSQQQELMKEVLTVKPELAQPGADGVGAMSLSKLAELLDQLRPLQHFSAGGEGLNAEGEEEECCEEDICDKKHT